MTTELKLRSVDSRPLPACDEQAADLLFSRLAPREGERIAASDADAPRRGRGEPLALHALLPPVRRPSNPRSPETPKRDRVADWIDDLRTPITVASIVFAVAIAAKAAWLSLGGAWDAGRPEQAAVTSPAASTPRYEKVLKMKPIEDYQVGERIAGRNPLREQADLIEPDEADWLTISFRMRQENGLWLWIDLLRPKEWVRANGVRPAATIHLDLPEMGAVGDAQVVDINPCPPIEQGAGTVITGTFKRESDGKHVVELRLEGQEEPTGVTDNHPYWSVDRQEFVEVGKLRIGELVDTEFGPRHVESVTPCHYRGYLYNLETTEHVFRVGSLGTLVHNSCPSVVNDVLNETASAVGKVTSTHFLNYDEALQAGMRWLGPGYREIGRAGQGVFRSDDGLRQFRIDPNSLLGKHSPHVPHVHFEWFVNPVDKLPFANNHVPIGP